MTTVLNIDAMLLMLEKETKGADRYLVQSAGPRGAAHNRLLNELRYARRVSLTAGGRYDELLSSALCEALRVLDANDHIAMADALRIEDMLAPMADACKRYTWMLAGHAHIDMNWMWSYEETVSTVLDTFRTMLRFMQEYPSFVFAQSQASTYRIVEEYDPEMLEEIKQAIARGQWEVTASGWVEADRNMPGMASDVRHLLSAKRYLSSLLDVPQEALNIDYEPDTFGHHANLPSLLNAGGVKYLYHCRGEEQRGLYRWQDGCGHELVALCDPDWYLIVLNASMAQKVPEFCEKFGMPAMLTVYGVGDHGGGPTLRDLRLIADMMTWPIFPTVRFARYCDFFALADKANLPVLTGERNVVFTGCYTSQSRIKRGNAQAERRLYDSEMTSAAAHCLLGAPYRAQTLEKAWRRTLFNHFHDIITGSGVPDTRDYALGEYQKVYAEAGSTMKSALNAICARINTDCVLPDVSSADSGDGAGAGYTSGYTLSPVGRSNGANRAYHLFNTLPYERTLVSEIMVWDYTEDEAFLLFTDDSGRELPHQVIERGGFWLHLFIRVLVEVTLPACGYATVLLKRRQDMPMRDIHANNLDGRRHHPFEMVLENDRVRAEFDTRSLRLTRFTDKQTGQTRLCDGGFDLVSEDPSQGMAAWIIGRYTSVQAAGEQSKVTVGAWGELRKEYKVEVRLGEHSGLKYSVSLDKGSKRVCCDVTCEWNERGSSNVSFPQLSYSVRLMRPEASFMYRVPGGTLARPGEALDKPSLGIIAAGGAALMSDCKYGFRGEGDTLRLALIRSSDMPDKLPEYGEIYFRIALEMTDERSLADMVDDFTHAAIMVSGTAHGGDLPLSHSFMRMTGGESELLSVKKAETCDGMMLYLCNPLAREDCVSFVFDREIANARATDILENAADEEAVVCADTLTLTLPPKAIRGVIVTFAQKDEARQ